MTLQWLKAPMIVCLRNLTPRDDFRSLLYPTHLYISVEKHDMPCALLLRPGVPLVPLAVCVRPQQQQVVHSARVGSGHRRQPLQPLQRAPGARISAGRCTQPRRLGGCRCYRGHGFGRSWHRNTHRGGSGGGGGGTDAQINCKRVLSQRSRSMLLLLDASVLTTW